MKTNVEDLLRKLLVEMIAHPEDLQIETYPRERSLTITIQAHAADTARLIGEGGGNYRAIASLMAAVGYRSGGRVNVPAIREPAVGMPERYSFRQNPNWPKGRIRQLVKETVQALVERPEVVRVEVDDDEETNSSVFQAFIGRTERMQLVDAVSGCLRTVFDAIGKANGRLVYVDLVPREEVEPPQPNSNAGRWA